MISTTHLSHVSRRTQHCRHNHNIRKRDPRRALRPAEVLVAVDHHVYHLFVNPNSCAYTRNRKEVVRDVLFHFMIAGSWWMTVRVC
jgi:hypothetical protein